MSRMGWSCRLITMLHVQAAGREERLQQSRALRAAALQFAPLVAESTGRPIGKLAIPKIGVNVVILEGTGTQDLRKAPDTGPRRLSPAWGATSLSQAIAPHIAPSFASISLRSGTRYNSLCRTWLRGIGCGG